jgi:hypothetical protein
MSRQPPLDMALSAGNGRGAWPSDGVHRLGVATLERARILDTSVMAAPGVDCPSSQSGDQTETCPPPQPLEVVRKPSR